MTYLKTLKASAIAAIVGASSICTTAQQVDAQGTANVWRMSFNY